MIIRKLINRTKVFLILILLSVSLPPAGFAHALEQTSAQIIMRDGQVELRLFLDVEHWVEKLQDPTAWLTGESNFIFINPDSTIETNTSTQGTGFTSTYISKLSDYLFSEIRIQLDSGNIQLIAVDQIKYLDQSALMEFRFSGQHSISNPQSIDVQFPVSLGDVHISIVQPQYGLVHAGEIQTFKLNLQLP